MATPSDTNTSSEPMDGSAGEPKRYAHGSGIGEALRARVLQKRDDADRLANKADREENDNMAFYWGGRYTAFNIVLEILDDLEADAAEIACEATRANS